MLLDKTKIEEFSDIIKKNIKTGLPGKFAQQKMSPSLRNTLNKEGDINNARKSSVLILIYEKNNTLHIPLILRTLGGNNHPGQISLPGGKYELSDTSLEYTALRETEEEIGINKKDVEIIAQLSDIYIPNSNFLVSPYIAYLKTKPLFNTNPFEVEDLLEVPIKEIFEEKNIQTFTTEINKHNINAPYYAHSKHKIWGATAMILSELKDLFFKL